MTDSCLNIFQEESLSCSKRVFHLTDGWGNPRESATETRLPAHTFTKSLWSRFWFVFFANI